MKKITGTILAMLLATLLIIACAKEEEHTTAKAPGKIDEITTPAAAAMVKKIRTPLDKARQTRNLGDQRLEEMDAALQNQ